MSVRVNRIFLSTTVLVCYVTSTRFLPSLIWDHENPQLCCPQNWLVVPRLDYYDRIVMVCPTLKLIVRQLKGIQRSEDSMNINIYRRAWDRSVDELKNSIRDGSIHSFCNVSHPDSMKLHTCVNGQYNSASVRFRHFQGDPPIEKYDKFRTYVFYSNGDGYASTLEGKEAKCSMFFAVYVTYNEQHQFDITYNKEVLPSLCQCDSSIKATLPTTRTTTTPTQVFHTTTSPPTAIPSGLEIVRDDGTTQSTRQRPHNINTTPTLPKTTTTVSRFPATDCDKTWISTSILIVMVLAAFVLGVLCAVGYRVVCRRTDQRDGYNNPVYSTQEQEKSLSDGRLTREQRV